MTRKYPSLQSIVGISSILKACCECCHHYMTGAKKEQQINHARSNFPCISYVFTLIQHYYMFVLVSIARASNSALGIQT